MQFENFSFEINHSEKIYRSSVDELKYLNSLR